jgi:iron-sulfur cluster repair protein YtfE (RIC family)
MRQEIHESLTELNHVHEELDGLFFQHQTAILKHDYDRAKTLLSSYEEALYAHMKEEDEILLPIYQERAGKLRGGDAETIVGEHKKIAEWLNRVKLRLHRLVPSVVDHRSLIALLDDEAHYKKFMEHHTLREDRIFYPEIERVVTPSEKAGLLRLLTFSLDLLPKH